MLPYSWLNIAFIYNNGSALTTESKSTYFQKLLDNTVDIPSFEIQSLTSSLFPYRQETLFHVVSFFPLVSMETLPPMSIKALHPVSY